MKEILIFHIENLRFGLDIFSIEKIIRATEIHPFPKNSPFFAGLLHFYEEWIPVTNMRALLGMKEREMELEDQLIICHHESKKLALWVDQVDFFIPLSPDRLFQQSVSLYPFTEKFTDHEGNPIFLLSFDLLFSLLTPYLADRITK